MNLNLQTVKSDIPSKLKTADQLKPSTKNSLLFLKGDGGDGMFDVRGGGPAFIFGSNLPIFLAARLISNRNFQNKIKLNFNQSTKMKMF